MSIAYHISARLYLLMSAVTLPAVCLACWLLLARVVRRGSRSYSRWLFPAAIGATVTAAGILLLAFIVLFNPADYGLAIAANVLNMIGLVFAVASFCRLWGVVKALPPSGDDDNMAESVQRRENTWPPPPLR